MTRQPPASPDGTANMAYRLAERLQRAQLRLAAAALVIMMLVTILDVFLRYLFNSPVRGSYEIVEATLVVFVFHGLAAGFFRRANIVIDVIDHIVGPRLVNVLIRLSDILAVAVLVIFAWSMIGQAMQAYEYGDRKLELGLPIYLLWIVALAGMAGTIFCALATAVTGAARRIFGGSER